MKKLILITILILGMTSPVFAQALKDSKDFYFDIILYAEAFEIDNGYWQYEYTLSAAEAPGPDYIFKELSHWWIELPEEKIPTLVSFSPEGVETYFNENSGPFDGFHYGVKWESDELFTYSFISTHSPVLTDSGEIDTNAYTWFAKSGVSGDYYDFGLTLGPNGHHNVVPEPTTLLLFGSSILGALGFRKKS